MATSGHSGVDRIVANLLPCFSEAGLRVDLLRVRDHGPWIPDLPAGVRPVELGRRHVTTSQGPLTRYLRRERPRVLLSDKDRANRTALRAVRRSGGHTRCFLRLGTTVSANLANKGVLEAFVERRSLRRYALADGVIVPSNGAAEDLALTAALPRERIHVLPNPIVTGAMEARISELQPPPDPWLDPDAELPVVLACGSLTPRKDYATLLRAFARIQHELPSRLVILGRGGEYDRLTRLSQELAIADRVQFPGFIDDPVPWMQHAAVFAHTSRWEGLGIVLVEALACGLPVVAMDCPSGPAEILDGGRAGVLVRPGDEAGFARALLDTLRAPPAAAEGRQRATRFRADVAARAYLDTLGLDAPGRD